MLEDLGRRCRHSMEEVQDYRSHAGFYTLFSLAEKWKLVAIQKLRRSFLGLADLHGELHPEAYRIVKIT